MERRKILLGTGATVATAFAGCLGSGDGDDGSGSENGSDGGNGENGDGGDRNDDNDHEDDVPFDGFDKERFESYLAKYGITVREYAYEAGHFHLTVKTETKLATKLREAKRSHDEAWKKEARERFEQVAESLRESISDEEKEKIDARLDTVRLTVLDDEKKPIFDLVFDVDRLLKLLYEFEDWKDVEKHTK